MKTLKLLANPNSLARYPNIELLNLRPPTRRFVGWNMVTVKSETGEMRVGFERKTEPEEVKFHLDYVQAVKCGDLIAADDETAVLCGVVRRSVSDLKEK